ncbi:GNAT family N-acetyltransferase [Clostridium saccharobutylicum]|uniref:Acetyltransferase, GNAT family n=1 Tax=Clostridium saccharobutylicum DSM 13864 TaxID=1345695 RepID=U5MZ53_CLOSA|nr:GNAT family N-acetyltransferase [Clostridium saccharobutylicum]AGX44911.1 acetyltransferase, GNAT family [Clostridium saccharobutylicum DSM 13864]AQR92192.1 hypothetical protein CLOSC_39220 [Clostridium saccharobutylicum]AQS02094.1 hypothetical protein CSACC_39270 [Clostridium saccharobutylicum]AQS11698.1 hypothetical protein CLOBY_38560 [Clostridium saccharobutylicum]AQS16077.1 hypothetical protein CLOSACC_39270 [Clostridium saccharobutylicum]
MEIELKQASKKDCDLLFIWANDIQVRENSFNSEKIMYEDHLNWFNNKISCDECVIFILYFDEIPIGQVRVDIENENGLISYSIDRNYRGKGLSIAMLSKLEIEINKSENCIRKLVGRVKFTNIASQKVFENLKYRKIIHTNFLEYNKTIK